MNGAALVRELASSRPAAGEPALDIAALARVVTRFAAAERLWRPLVRYERDRRAYLRLAWTAQHEVWLLCWGGGQAVQLHDHGGASGAFVVAQGVLREEYLSGVAVRRVSCRPGTVRGIPAQRIHTVWNPGPRPAVSIHAYSPPLSAMTFYARDGGAEGVRATHAERVREEAP